MITVIIPTYNNEDTISRAINSVIAQTFTEWQLIIVNDCSTDNTLNIINEYVEKYPEKIKVISNKVNQGVGVSRLNGIKKTKTKYITFLDSDDYLREDFLEMNYKLAQEKDYDVVYTSFGIEYDHPQIKGEKLFQSIPSGELDMSEEATPQLHFIQQMKFLTGKLFKTDLVRSIPWSTKRIGEDVQTLFFATYMANRVRSSNYVGYIHVFRENSLLADAPKFLCFCHSTLAEFEILEFLYERKDWKLFDYLMQNNYNNYEIAKNAIIMGAYDKDDMMKNKKEWETIQKWYSKHKNDYLKRIEQ